MSRTSVMARGAMTSRATLSAIENLADAREGLIRGHTFAAIQFGGGLVNQWLCPFEIVFDRGHEVSNGHGHRLFKRGKVARLDLGFQPPLLLGRKLDRHIPSLAHQCAMTILPKWFWLLR